MTRSSETPQQTPGDEPIILTPGISLIDWEKTRAQGEAARELFRAETKQRLMKQLNPFFCNPT